MKHIFAQNLEKMNKLDRKIVGAEIRKILSGLEDLIEARENEIGGLSADKFVKMCSLQGEIDGYVFARNEIKNMYKRIKCYHQNKEMFLKKIDNPKME